MDRHTLQDEGNPLNNADEEEFFAPTPYMNDLVGSEIIVLPDNCARGDAVQILSRGIETNQFGLPTHFIRSDLLPSLATGSVSQLEVDSASTGLFYQEGYPTLQDGRAFWSQLVHEPIQAFNLFQRYIDQAEEHGIRQLDLLSVSEGVPLDTLRQMYLEFYWSSRARAYDLFIVAAEERKRQLRTRKMESSHFDKAQHLLDALLKKFEDDEWFEELNAKEAIEAMVELAKLQRMSMGLTGQHASSLPRERLPEGASVQAIMEHLTRGANVSQDTADNFNAKLQALFDGDDGMVLQEAILRVSRPDVIAPRSGATLGDDM